MDISSFMQAVGPFLSADADREKVAAAIQRAAQLTMKDSVETIRMTVPGREVLELECSIGGVHVKTTSWVDAERIMLRSLSAIQRRLTAEDVVAMLDKAPLIVPGTPGAPGHRH